MQPARDARRHDGRRQHGRTSNLAPIVDDDQPLFEQDAGTRLQPNDRRAVRGDVVRTAAHSIGDPGVIEPFTLPTCVKFPSPSYVRSTTPITDSIGPPGPAGWVP
jgi:hypothetical protein